ncbi:MAG TPA: lactate racemase domain-containing protein, partial [Blastocatellia bacterium]|nr:lactate racemase domain-containing protein [Blastocatellia bacterium]
MVIGKGSETGSLTEDDVRELMAAAIADAGLSGKRILIIIPDGTRTAPIPMMFRLFFEHLGKDAASLDYLIALGTHRIMTEAEINRLVGITTSQRSTRYSNVRILNHRWDLPETFVTLGQIATDEVEELTGGLMRQSVNVRINKIVLDYDCLIVCGPTFPHEVVGFSGGNKYFFPGIGGPE